MNGVGLEERKQRKLNIEQLTVQRYLGTGDFIVDKALAICSAIFYDSEMRLLLKQLDFIRTMEDVLSGLPALQSAVVGAVRMMEEMVIKNSIQRKLCKLLWLESAHYPRKLKKRTRLEVIIDYRLCDIFEDIFTNTERGENVNV